MLSLVKVLLLASILSAGLVAAEPIKSCNDIKGKTFTLGFESSVSIDSAATVKQVNVTKTHLICEVIQKIRKDEKKIITYYSVYKLDTMLDDGANALTLLYFNDPLRKGDLTYSEVPDTKAPICTGDTTKFYTIKLSEAIGQSIHITCDGTEDFKVYKANVLECAAIQRAAQLKEAKFRAAGSEQVTIPKGARVELVGISFCFSFLLTAYSTNSSI